VYQFWGYPGWPLFRHDGKDNERRELVVFITPRLVGTLTIPFCMLFHANSLQVFDVRDDLAYKEYRFERQLYVLP
jgi:hypothetical protein